VAEPDTRPERAHPDVAAYLALLAADRPFEAHEALEAAWRRSGDPLAGAPAAQALIQVAAAYVHRSRLNVRGARTLIARAAARLGREDARGAFALLSRSGVAADGLAQRLEALGPDPGAWPPAVGLVAGPSAAEPGFAGTLDGGGPMDYAPDRTPLPTRDVDGFFAYDVRVGTVRSAVPNPGARKPAYVLTIDFGPLGSRTTSAQLTRHYRPEELVGRQVVAVLNFPPRRVAGVVSEVLVLGACAAADDVVLLHPGVAVADGTPIA